MGLVVVAYSSLSGKGRGGRLFEAGRLLTFSASRMGAYSRWALIRGWALIRINTVCYMMQTLPKIMQIANLIQEKERGRGREA